MIILKEIKAFEIVEDGVSPADDADNTEVDAYDHLSHTQSTRFLPVVLQDILEMTVKPMKSYLMLARLRPNYYRDSACALHSQIVNLVSLAAQYSSRGLREFICKFEFLCLNDT